MAILDPLHPLQSAITEFLAHHHGVSIKALHAGVRRDYGVEISSQNLYRSVGLLLAAQVLVREGRLLSLNRIWAGHVRGLAAVLQENYFVGQAASSKFPHFGERPREYRASSLMQLDPLWSDVLVELGTQARGGELFAYNSHPWYSIGMRDTERRVMRGLVDQGFEVFMLYGNETFLDRYGKRLIEIKGFHTKCSAQHSFPKEGYACWVAGPYVIEVDFPPLIAKQFKFFFDSVMAVEQLDVELFSNLFSMKARCSLKISHDKERSRRLKATLKKQF